MQYFMKAIFKTISDIYLQGVITRKWIMQTLIIQKVLSPFQLTWRSQHVVVHEQNAKYF
jgi:hypothetical protein